MAKMALLQEKARPCPLDYPCHLFHHNFVAAVTMKLVVIAHVDYWVVVPAAIAVANIDCTAADCVDPPVVFAVSVWPTGMMAA